MIKYCHIVFFHYLTIFILVEVFREDITPQIKKFIFFLVSPFLLSVNSQCETSGSKNILLKNQIGFDFNIKYLTFVTIMNK